LRRPGAISARRLCVSGDTDIGRSSLVGIARQQKRNALMATARLDL